MKPKSKSVFSISISLKLMAIITLLIAFSLVSMIFFASYLFKSDVELRIVENNHSRASVVASRISSDFTSIMKTANIASTFLIDNDDTEKISLLSKMIFADDNDLLYIALARKNDSNIQLVKQVKNTKLLSELDIDANLIEKAILSKSDEFLRSLDHDQVILNISPMAGAALLGISIPLRLKEGYSQDTFIIVCITPSSICEVVKSEGITKTLVVNRSGDILAHEDIAMILSGTNISRLPIIVDMQTSPIDNGQSKYKDEHEIEYLGSFKKIDFGSIGVASYAETDKAFQSVEIIQRRNTLILIIVLNAALIVGFVFSKTITNPIKRLVKSMKEVAQGNFGYQISKIPRDEIGQLMTSFNKMNKGLQEREKIKSAFGRFVNRDLAERLLNEEIKLGGERKRVTIFFSDIRSFTAISEKLQPEEVVSFLNEYMTLMVDCVNRNKGTVDKFIGDAIMALWGTPVSYGNDVENAINAALLMRQTLINFNKNRGSSKRPRISIGCGINTGTVLAGQIGSQEKMDYTVIGDAVNLASRIEQLNKAFGTDILLSEESYAEVRDIFRCIKMQKIYVKGKEKALQIWAVMGRADDPDTPASIDELRELVGINYSTKSKSLLAEKKYSLVKNKKQ